MLLDLLKIQKFSQAIHKIFSVNAYQKTSFVSSCDLENCSRSF